MSQFSCIPMNQNGQLTKMTLKKKTDTTHSEKEASKNQIRPNFQEGFFFTLKNLFN